MPSNIYEKEFCGCKYQTPDCDKYDFQQLKKVSKHSKRIILDFIKYLLKIDKFLN